MTEHKHIWLEPAGAPDRCWCQDNQWGDEGVEYVLASTLESLQRENDALKNLIDGDNCADPDKIDALFRRAEAAEAEVKRLRGELSFYSCDGSTCDCIPGQEDANSVTCGFRARTALASTGGEHHDN